MIRTLYLLCFAVLGLVQAHALATPTTDTVERDLTNAERFQRGLGPNPPRRVYDASRTFQRRDPSPAPATNNQIIQITVAGQSDPSYLYYDFNNYVWAVTTNRNSAGVRQPVFFANSAYFSLKNPYTNDNWLDARATTVNGQPGAPQFYREYGSDGGSPAGSTAQSTIWSYQPSDRQLLGSFFTDAGAALPYTFYMDPSSNNRLLATTGGTAPPSGCLLLTLYLVDQ